MELKAGNRLRSAVSDAEFVVIRAPGSDVDLRCGGLAVIDARETPSAGDTSSQPEGSVELGKRYVDEADSLELLCTKSGSGSLSVGNEPLLLKGARPLPSSD